MNEDLEDSRKENKAVITAIMKDEWKGFHHAQEKKMMQPVDTTFPLDQLTEIAETISKWSPKAAKMIKEEIKMNDFFPLNESLSLERKLLLWQSSDHDEGINSFIVIYLDLYLVLQFLHFKR